MAHRPNPNGAYGQPPQKRQRLQPSQQQHANQRQQRQKQNNQHQRPAQRHEFHRFLEIGQINILSKEVYDWIYAQCALSDNVEIEVKLGKMMTIKEPTDQFADEQKQSAGGGDEIRVHEKMGIKSLAWIDLFKVPNSHFESTVDENVFLSLNKTFNAWYANCTAAPHQRLEPLRKFEFPIMTYERARTVDKIYKTDVRDTKSSVRVSLSIDKNTNEFRIKECIQKTKKSSMNIIYPAAKYDFRISASIENVVPKPQNQIVWLLRCKDRISYKYDKFSIDITSTHTYSDGLTPVFIKDVMNKFKNMEALPMDIQYGTKRSYEVELEIADHKYLANARRLAAGSPRQPAKLQQLCYFFTQAAIQIAEVASNPSFVPSVCRLPQRK